MSAQAPTVELTPTAQRPPAARRGVGRGWGTPATGRLAQPASALAVAGVLCFATFVAGGGLRLQTMTVVEIALTLAGGLIVAVAALTEPGRRRVHGAWPVTLLVAFAVLTAVSVAWSVVPDSSWQDAARMLAYSAVFAAAVALARIAPGGWAALLEGIVLASAIVCGYALLTKVFPGHVGSQSVYARLQEPYGYWNAIGLTAALGAIGCLWLGARRSGHALASATAYPAMSVLLVTLMLAYSRGALAVLVVGLALWLWLVPLRLRGSRVLVVGGLGAAAVVAWDFSRHALTSDGVALSQRAAAGHQLGVLLLAMVLVEALAGVAIGFFGARRAPTAAARRRAGALLVALLVLALAGGAGALAASRRGFTGTISHAFRSLTDPNAPVPPNTPGRLTAIGSVRARYWREALDVFRAHPALGAGAAGYETARLRYRRETLDVKHAHGYLVQTLADLGIAGLAVTLALLAAWLACAARATRPLNRRWRLRRDRVRLRGRTLAVPRALEWLQAPAPYTPERIGLLSMLCIAVAFGVHSFVDWTWYVPGNACVALLCAGWLAGRGPLAPDAPRRVWRVRTDPRALAIAGAAIAAALLAAWTQWQPQRSAEDSERALAVLVRDPAAARAAAQAAVDADPLSTQALFTLSAVQHARGEAAAARATLQKAVRTQPSNPQTWLALGQYDRTADPAAAVGELRAAVYLDPRSVESQNAYVEALRAAPSASATGGTRAGGTQNRLRTARPSSTARAPGGPAAPRTSTASKPKSASRAASVRRV